MRVAEEEANQATAAALVAETKVKQAEMRSQAVEDESAQTAAKNAELLEQLQQARGELVGAEERARLSDERFRAASERVEVVEGQLKELKVRLTVAKTDLPIGAVADNERSALKDGLATQVRRPLTSILGVSLALQHNDPESRDGRELVRQLGTNARKLDRMVGVLLEIDRLADGTLRLNRRRTDLQALVRRVVEDSPDLANRNVHVEAEKVVVPVDPFMVEEMVDTLLSNANARTSSASPVWIKVSSDPEGAVIAVDDTGADVPEERRTHLTSSSEEQMDGAGRGGKSTGLAVLQRLAEVHAGRAWVEEREGGGASFRVFLPDVTEGAAEAAAGQAADRHGGRRERGGDRRERGVVPTATVEEALPGRRHRTLPEVGPPRAVAGRCSNPGALRPMDSARHMEQSSQITRVLVVDDHEVFSEALEMFLGRQPDVRLVGSARDADEAMALLGEEPDVVLMDLDMPGTDGIEATRRIRDAAPDAKVVLLTGVERPEAIAEALSAGRLRLRAEIASGGRGAGRRPASGRRRDRHARERPGVRPGTTPGEPG